MIDTKLLTLLKVIEVGSYTEAAKQLNLTQPAVSQHIRALEEEFDVKLFEHSGNRIVPTNECRMVANMARNMKMLYAKLMAELTKSKGGKEQLNVGITHTIESNRITEALARYAIENNDISLHLFSGAKDELVTKIKNNELDFAIIHGNVDDPSIAISLIDEDDLMLVVSPEHPLAKRKTANISQIKNENLLLRFPNSGTGNLFKSALIGKNMSIDEFNVKLEIDNVATIKDLIRQGYGISVLPKSTCLSELKKGKLVALPIDGITMKRVANIIYLKDYPNQHFIHEILEIYKEMYI